VWEHIASAVGGVEAIAAIQASGEKGCGWTEGGGRGGGG
jgi:hypothetical protein